MTVVEWCVSGARDLTFSGREFHQRREELRSDRLAHQPGGNRRKGKAQMIWGTSSAGMIDICALRRYFGSVKWRRLCIIEMVLH